MSCKKHKKILKSNDTNAKHALKRINTHTSCTVCMPVDFILESTSYFDIDVHMAASHLLGSITFMFFVFLHRPRPPGRRFGGDDLATGHRPRLKGLHDDLARSSSKAPGFTGLRFRGLA